ncbi:uncharacterized protein LOC133859670 isoform X3 [Alnus glutinosa]|uniref:uncharacterized protein LOC133859670 isoform X2 n=1 Tax=Alnus glutinosa TaxID=3517 RepID=UPI002D7752F4|nr:uncharacterized protein LOC133859670 isoform X2 [Alnus glutinosa]XP_062151147.1 uncharacterized protein LOC133859670 isoform X3 [Alnus glutinosa]
MIMKTNILIICILFASLLLSPSSILARELAESTGGNGQIGNPNNPAFPIKCDPKSSTYSHCIGQTKPEPKCKPNGVYARCPGTGSSGKPNNPAVKPGTGSSGNPNNPAVKPGTGQPNDPTKGPITKCDPESKNCLVKQKPKPKCNPSNVFERCSPPQDP